MRKFIASICAAAVAIMLSVPAAAANLVTQVIDNDFSPSLAAATVSGDAYVNDGNTFFVVTNGGGAPITVTFEVVRTLIPVPGLGTVTFADNVVSVPAGETRWVVVPKGPYNDSNGRVQVTYSGVTSVTVGAVRVPEL